MVITQWWSGFIEYSVHYGQRKYGLCLAVLRLESIILWEKEKTRIEDEKSIETKC